MNEKYWLSDKLFQYVLERIELSPSATFRESELTRISPETFGHLKDEGFLKKQYRDLNATFVDDDGERYRVTKLKGKLVGWPLSPESGGTIILTEDQRTFYRPSIATLVEAIRHQNKLFGKPSESGERLVFVGEAGFGHDILRVCLGFFDGDDQAKAELFSAGSRFGMKGRILVICPTFEPGFDLLAELDSRDIVCVNFGKAFKGDNYEVDFSVARRGKVTVAGSVTPMTADEEATKRKFGYKGWDILTFLNERAGYGSYFIEINGMKEKIPPSLMLLLLCFAQKIKKDKQGWVSREEAAELKIIDPYKDNHYDDLVHKLRGKIGPHLMTCGRDEFIETNDKKFRISVPPGRINTPTDRWLGDTFKEIQEALLNKRSKKGEQWRE